MRLVVVRLGVARRPFVVAPGIRPSVEEGDFPPIPIPVPEEGGGAARWLAARGVREEASAKGEASRPAAEEIDFVAFASRASKPDLPISPATYEDGRLLWLWLWLGLASPRSVSPRVPKAARSSPPPKIRGPRRYSGVTGALSATRRDAPKAPPEEADPTEPRDEKE